MGYYLLTKRSLKLYSQVLRQLAPEVSYRSLVMLGVASIQGLAVASFEKADAERLLYFCSSQLEKNCLNDPISFGHPSWLTPPAPTRKRAEPFFGIKSVNCSLQVSGSGNNSRKLNIAAMRPIPHSHSQKIQPFSGLFEGERLDGDRGKSNLPIAPRKHNGIGSASVTNRKSSSTSFQAQQIVTLNPLPMKKHDCERAPIQDCSEVYSVSTSYSLRS